MTLSDDDLRRAVEINVAAALAEDVGTGDLTAVLLPPGDRAAAHVISRESVTLAGQPWFDAVFRQIDPSVRIDWRRRDGDTIEPGETLCMLSGVARSLLTGERTALNFLQLLSATATATARYVAAVAGTGARILDTRKTLPGLRVAQKYAVRCAGGINHRMGLFDAILIKENHILASGGIERAVAAARRLHGTLPVEIEVETVEELRQALAASAERILLDNFAIGDLRQAVRINRDEGDPPAELEASGGITLATIGAIAATGVDYISVGSLTKDVRAVDLSMRIE